MLIPFPIGRSVITVNIKLVFSGRSLLLFRLEQNFKLIRNPQTDYGEALCKKIVNVIINTRLVICCL